MQPPKALSLIVLTVAGMMMFFRAEQPSKACLSMAVICFGRETRERLLQFVKYWYGTEERPVKYWKKVASVSLALPESRGRLTVWAASYLLTSWFPFLSMVAVRKTSRTEAGCPSRTSWSGSSVRVTAFV